MAIQDLLAAVQSDFGKKWKKKEDQPLLRLASDVPPATGLAIDNPLLEFILDRRFLAYGRCNLIYGKKGCSKTSLFLYLAKLFQQNGGDVVWIETEKAADLDYAKKQGVDTSRLIMPETDSLQQALTTAELVIKNLPKAYPDGNTPVLICLDSIAGCITDYELGDDINVGQVKIGEHARIMSSFYRRIVEPLSHEKAIFLGLNQLKDKIGGMSGFGEPGEALIGGEAQRFHSTYQLKVVRTKDMVMAQANGAERKVGSRHKITCKRNKLGREGNSQEIEFDLYIDGGPDFYSPLVRKLGDEYKTPIFKKKGYYDWLIPNVEYDTVDELGNPCKALIPCGEDAKSLRESELAGMIARSTQAKDIIRKEFEIPDLPPQEIVEEIEKENKKKRGRKKVEDVDDTKAIKDIL